MVLLPKTGPEGAVVLAEELRKELREIRTNCSHGITASFGVSCSRYGDTVDSLVGRADLLMYKAKAAGRDCVIFG